jgi:hypothetical protein
MPFPDLSEDRVVRRARKRAVVVQVETDGTLWTQEGLVHYSTGDALLTDNEGSGPVLVQTYELFD